MLRSGGPHGAANTGSMNGGAARLDHARRVLPHDVGGVCGGRRRASCAVLDVGAVIRDAGAAMVYVGPAVRDVGTAVLDAGLAVLDDGPALPPSPVTTGTKTFGRMQEGPWSEVLESSRNTGPTYCG